MVVVVVVVLVVVDVWLRSDKGDDAARVVARRCVFVCLSVCLDPPPRRVSDGK